MTTTSAIKSNRNSRDGQDLLVIDEEGRGTSGLLPKQLNDSYLAAFLLSLRPWERDSKSI